MVWTVLLASTVTAAGVPSLEVPDRCRSPRRAPRDLREGATVLGYNPQSELVRLREGKNELPCGSSKLRP
jgi:hypothetical protein